MKTLYILIPLFLLLSFKSESQQLSVQTGHSSTVLDLKYSPDGKYLISSGIDNKIIIWDLRSSKQMNIFSGHNGPVNSICFHPNEKIIASGSDDKTVKIWEYPSGKLIKTYDFFSREVKAIDFNPQGSELACASDSIYVINYFNETHKTIDKPARRMYTTVKYSSFGKYLAYGGNRERKVRLFNLAKNKVTKRLKIRSNQIIFDKNEIYLYAAGINGNIKRFPLSKISARKKLNLPAERTWHSFYSVDVNERYLFGANKTGLIYAYNNKTGRRKFILNGHQEAVKSLAVSPDGKFLASTGNDKKINIWDIENERVAKVLEGGTGSINSISFSNDGKQIFIAYDNTDFRLWNLQKKGEILFGTCPDLNVFERNSRKEYFTENSTNYIYSENLLIKTNLKKADKRTDNYLSSNENLLIYNTKKDEKFLLKSPRNTDYQSFLIADTSSLIVFKNKSTHSQKYSLLNWEPIRDREQIFHTTAYKYELNEIDKNGKLKIKYHHKKQSYKIKGDVYYKSISDNGKTLLALVDKKRGRSTCEIIDLDSMDQTKSFSYNTVYKSAGFSSKLKYLYFISGHKDSIYIQKMTDSIYFKSFYGSGPVTFSDDGRYCIYADKEKNIYFYDLESDSLKFKFYTNHLTSISSIKVNPKFNYFATSGYDGIIKFWDNETGENMVSLAAFNETDYVYVTEDNFYYSTVGSMNYINFMLNEKLYSFEQFDVKYNRPDLVLSKLPYSTNAEIIAYKKAYYKRLKKMGFNTEIEKGKFHIPKVSIENLSSFQISSLVDTISVKISAIDTVYPLNRINVWINDVPVYGIHGKDISEYKLNKYSTLQKITLTPGKNKIQVSANNSKGYESLRETFYIDYDAETVQPDLYLVTIGVSKHKASEYNLEYAAKDAGDISALFKKSNKTYKKIRTIEIFDTVATRKNIIKAKDFLKNSKINDVVVVFFAGHGMLDNEMDYYLATTDIDFENPSKSGLEYDMLEGLLNEIPARKKILLIDACHSGEVDTDYDTKKVIIDESEGLDNKSRGSDSKNEGDPIILKQSSFELMKHMFADIRKGTGSTIISSAGGAEFAYESDKMKNGIFTYILLHGLSSGEADLNKDGDVMVSELRDYLMNNVSKLTKGYQNPTCRRINLEFDFKIW